jgi:dihydrofolate reductase
MRPIQDNDAPLAAQQMPEVAKGMNAAEKYVASRAIKPTWNRSSLLNGDAVDSSRRLRQTQGSSITLLGSGTLAAQLGAAGLVDHDLRYSRGDQ